MAACENNILDEIGTGLFREWTEVSQTLEGRVFASSVIHRFCTTATVEPGEKRKGCLKITSGEG